MQHLLPLLLPLLPLLLLLPLPQLAPPLLPKLASLLLPKLASLLLPKLAPLLLALLLLQRMPAAELQLLQCASAAWFPTSGRLARYQRRLDDVVEHCQLDECLHCHHLALFLPDALLDLVLGREVGEQELNLAESD